MSIEHLSHQEKRALLEKLLRKRMESAWPDLDADARVDVVPAGDAVDPNAEPREIFLTGATGFVGAFVLRELLDQTGARIHCLVRAADEEEALRRVETNLRSYDVWPEGLNERVVPVPGDLATPDSG